jgi:5-methylcytosine-specific restriction protein A
MTGGLVVLATVVDHVIPHRGDVELFWKPGNHQALCKACHDRKTVLEDGGLGGGVNWYPPFLGRSLVPLTVVCGAPLSGKSWLVRREAGPRDLVIDVDQIGARICGTGLHDWPRSRLTEVGRERNRMLAALSDHGAAGRWERAWLIACEPEATRRQWWAETMRPERIVVVETPRWVCDARARAERSEPERWSAVIDEWWRAYGRRPGDEVVAGEG